MNLPGSPGVLDRAATTCGLLILTAIPLFFWSSVVDVGLWPKLLLAHVLAFCYVLVWLFTTSHRTEILRLRALDLPVLLFFAIHVVSWTVAINPFKTGLVVARMAVAVSIYFAVSRTFHPRRLGPWLVASACTMAVVSLIGIAEYLGVYTGIRSAGIPSATFFYRNFVAMYLVIALPLAAAGFVAEPCGIREWFWASCGTLGVILLLYTRTRGAWVGMAGGLVLTGIGVWVSMRQNRLDISKFRILGRRKALIAACSLAVILAAAQVPPAATLTGKNRTLMPAAKAGLVESATSIAKVQDSGRLPLWRDTIRMIAESPLAGVGLGNWDLLYPRYAREWPYKSGTVFVRPHNDYLWIASELGLPAMLIYLWIVGMSLVLAWRGFARSSSRIDVGLYPALAASVLAISGHALFSFPRERITATVFLWLLFGILAGVSARREKIPIPRWQGIVLPACAAIGLVLGTVYTVQAWKADGALLRSLYHLDAERYDLARQEANASLSWGLHDFRVLITKAHAHHMLGDGEGAVQALHRLSEVHPNAIAGYQNLGAYSYSLGKLEDARTAYIAARRLDPLNPHHHRDLGIVYRDMGDYAAAGRSLQKSLDLAPGDSKARFLLGTVAGLAGNLEEALAAFERVVAQDSTLTAAYRELGAIALKMKRHDAAIAAYERVVTLDSTVAEVHLGLGVLYEEREDTAKAVASYARFLATWTGNRQAAADVEQKLAGLGSSGVGR